MKSGDNSTFLAVDTVHSGLERAFADVGILGYEYTLADGDFMDDWRWYPDTCHFYSNGYALQAKYFREVWPAKSYRVVGVKEALESQVRSETRAYKAIHWSEESPDYIKEFSEAFCFLNEYSLAHYYAAWMSLDLRGLFELNDSGASGRFFDALISQGPCLAKGIRSFDSQKKSAIADFLILSAQAPENGDKARFESKVIARFALKLEYLAYASEALRSQYLQWDSVRSPDDGESEMIRWVENSYQRDVKFWSERG